MCVTNSGWIDWFAKSGFSQTPIFELCVLQKLLYGWLATFWRLFSWLAISLTYRLHLVVEWLNWQSWQKIFLAKLIFRIMCVPQLWLNWLNGLLSPKIPRKTQFSKNVCRKQWLNWLIRQIWILANSNFQIVCIAKAVEMVDLPLFSDCFVDWQYH